MNALRRLLQMGYRPEDFGMSSDPMTGEIIEQGPDENALRQMIEQAGANNQDVLTAPQRYSSVGNPVSTVNGDFQVYAGEGMPQTRYLTQAVQEAAQQRQSRQAQGQAQGSMGGSLRVVGAGNGSTVELSPEVPPARLDLDYSRPPVDVPGVGKVYYDKSGRGAYAVDGNGNPTAKVILGYDDAGSRARNKENLAADKTRQEIAQSQASVEHAREQVAASQQNRLGGKLQAPPGYQWTETGGLKPIPGGPADFKQQGMYNADTATLQSSQADLDRLATSANELLKAPGLGRITGIPGMFSNVPGMAGADAQAKLNTLKSQVGFGVLQAMRNASKTGGALGNVSDAEGKRLEANLAALENAQSEGQMRESLQKIVDFAQQAKDRLANAYQIKYSGQMGQVGQQPAAPARGSQGQPANSTEQPLVMPRSKNQLVIGKIYQTGRGPARWNGTAFEQ